MPFDFSNGPSIFMRLMDEVFCPFTGYFVVVYFDDILVYNKSEEEHFVSLKKSFQSIEEIKVLYQDEVLILLSKHHIHCLCGF